MGGQLLDGKRRDIFYMDPDELTIVGVDTDDGPEHPLWDERIKLPIDESMVLNIMQLGVQQTVRVEVIVEKGKKIALVADGRRRVQHARAANKRLRKAGDTPILVPCLATKGTDETKLGLIGVALNEIRVDDPVMVRAAKASRMHDRGHSNQDIANAFGVNVQTIAMWLQICGLSTTVKKAIDAGKITPTAAAKLAGLSAEEQGEALDKLVSEGGKLTVGRASAAAKNKRKKNGDSDAVAAPPRRALRRVVDRWETTDEGTDISEDFIRGVRFAIGDLNPASVAGLTAMMKKPERKSATKE